MSRYWIASHLAALFPQPIVGQNVITPSSNPINITELERLTLLVEGAVHGAAGAAGYAVPIPSTATDAWEYIRGVVRDGAGYESFKVIPGGGQHAEMFRLSFQRAMEEIRSGKQPILGAPKEGGENARAFVRVSGVATPVITWDWQP